MSDTATKTAEEKHGEAATLAATAKSWETELERFIGEHPRLTIGAAAAAGLLLGWMVKRK